MTKANLKCVWINLKAGHVGWPTCVTVVNGGGRRHRSRPSIRGRRIQDAWWRRRLPRWWRHGAGERVIEAAGLVNWNQRNVSRRRRTLHEWRRKRPSLELINYKGKGGRKIEEWATNKQKNRKQYTYVHIYRHFNLKEVFSRRSRVEDFIYDLIHTTSSYRVQLLMASLKSFAFNRECQTSFKI